MGNGDAQGNDWEAEMWKAVDKQNTQREQERQDAAKALEYKNDWDERDRQRQKEIEDRRHFPPPQTEPRVKAKPETAGSGTFWIVLLAQVLIVGLGIYLHLWIEALLLVNVVIGALSLVILSLLAFGGNAKKWVWLLWVPTVVIGYLVYKGSLPNGDFLFWLAVLGGGFTVYSIYRIISSLSHK